MGFISSWNSHATWVSEEKGFCQVILMYKQFLSPATETSRTTSINFNPEKEMKDQRWVRQCLVLSFLRK
ncbi:CLUMA_CG000408, isoform A [Clunio marinus]|uniref:CLUMA_CG000408, isoform A n=1 Tax=Clunio marinus TaxID=568069 RepID=A0A1J1HJ01_9DIPT|nr:CLUMA_CG000408, isoform A [Clunio marinus]